MPSQISGPVRVRFAPSPTGFLHVGGARTAIYNELLRQNLGGSHILRIEDTDRARSDDAMIEQIRSALDWLGVGYDEGPYLQSQRIETHRAAAHRLLAEGKAYTCFRSSEELDAMRKEVLGRGDSYRYRTAFERPPSDEIERRLAAGEPFAVRFRMPDEDVVVEDCVRDAVTFPAESLDDFIILRSDGSPTYHLSVVCDDIDMNVTLVLRGEDHLSNTPKHIGLFRALGAEVPAFGHLPLIMGADKKRLSKRTGATSVEEFRDQGLLPQAIYNYLTLLGWSPGDDREIMSRSELIETFTAERFGKNAAVFDVDKLRWMNAHYMADLPFNEVFAHLQPFLPEFGLADAEPALLRHVAELHRVRSKDLRELATSITHYFRDDVEYDVETSKKFLRQPELPDLLDTLAERYRALDVYDIESTDQALRAQAEEAGVKAGYLIHPTRIALSGSKAGPPLFDLVVAVGRDRGQRRFSAFTEFLRANAEAPSEG